MSLDVIPLWIFFVGTMIIILLSVEVGFEFGSKAARGVRKEKESPVAAMGGAVLGLVAFMLAFTFGIAAGRFDMQKELVREDANAIRTAWLRADFLPEPDRSDVRTLLKNYLEIRVVLVEFQNIAMMPKAGAESIAIQKRLWEYVAAHAKTDLNSDIGALVVESINDVINAHAVRVSVAIETRIPAGIWIILYALAILGMLAMGYQLGISGSTRSRTSVILAISFALVITLIAGLDRPNTPFVSVTQKPLRDVQLFMEQQQRAATTTPS